MSSVRELVWHNDGHILTLTLSKETVRVGVLACPHGEKEGSPCYHQGTNGCIVKYFINMYGLEVNIGEVEASHHIEIAWSKEGSDWDIDLVNFVVMPLNDPTFKDWLEAQQVSE